MVGQHGGATAWSKSIAKFVRREYTLHPSCGRAYETLALPVLLNEGIDGCMLGSAYQSCGHKLLALGRGTCLESTLQSVAAAPIFIPILYQPTSQI